MAPDLTPPHDDGPSDIAALDDLQIRYLTYMARGQRSYQALNVLKLSQADLNSWRSNPAFARLEGSAFTQGVSLALGRAMNARLVPTAVQRLAKVLDDPEAHDRDAISAAENILDRGGLPRQSHPADTEQQKALEWVAELRTIAIAQQRSRMLPAGEGPGATADGSPIDGPAPTHDATPLPRDPASRD